MKLFNNTEVLINILIVYVLTDAKCDECDISRSASSAKPMTAFYIK